MKILFFLLLINMSCSHLPTKKNLEGKQLQSILESYWEVRSRLFPLEATSQGDHRYNHLLPNDQTASFRSDIAQFYALQLTKLEKINSEILHERDKISYDIFKYEMQMQLEGLKDNGWMIPVNQFWGLPLTMPQLGTGDSFQPFATVKDYENWISRVKGFSAWVDSAIDNMKKGIEEKYVLPKSLVVKIIPQMKELIVTDPSKSLFYQPITKFPKNFSEAEKKKLTDEYILAIKNEINPSYKKLAVFLEKEYLPKARSSSGISSLKDGKKSYEYLAKLWTTTDLTPDQIHQLGLNEVARIRKEMDLVQKEVAFKGSRQAFFNYMRNDSKFMPYTTAEEVLNAFRAIHTTITPHVNSMFNLKPKAKFEIRQTEAFRAASSSAEYQPATPDGSRPGIFYIPIVDAKKFNITSGMESLFLHEAIPGHHYQVSIQQENDDLPKFRQFSWYGAYGEGWALYTESLGKDLGLYTDPYQYMGALGDEMHRAIRLVVDVAIHLKGMSREDAIKYMMDNEAISLEGATAEIERYMAIPGQALSYKVGSLKIWELRNRYKKELGDKFNLAEFHDEYLRDGCMPLAVIEQKMNAWAKNIK